MENKFKSYKDLSETSIEEWAMALNGQEKVELTSDEAVSLVVMGCREKEIEEDKEVEALLKGWNGAAILHKRLNLHTYTMSKAAILFCGTLGDSPGEIVMMANYFQYRCHLHHIKHIDMMALSEKIIPDGWFSRHTLQKFWDRQKYVSENDSLLNMLDNSEYGKSIRDL